MNLRNTHSINILTFIILVCGYCFPFQTLGQSPQELEKIRELRATHGILKSQRLNMQLDTAIQLSKQGFYADANNIFVDLLGKMDRIPSDLVYYFGKNSFYLKKYAQSVDWLNKYIELKGSAGRFSESALKSLKEAEKNLLQSKQEKQPSQKKTPIPVWSWSHKIPCKGTDKIICPVCHGSEVIVTSTPLGERYRACPYCSHRGWVTCKEYNNIVEGKLDYKNYKY